MVSLSPAAQHILAQGHQLVDEVFSPEKRSSHSSSSVHHHHYHHHRSSFWSPFWSPFPRTVVHHHHHTSPSPSFFSSRREKKKKKHDHTLPLMLLTLFATAVTAGAAYYLSTSKHSHTTKLQELHELKEAKKELSSWEKSDPTLKKVIEIQKRLLKRKAGAFENKTQHRRGQLLSGALAIGGGLGGLVAGPAAPIAVTAAYGLGALGATGFVSYTVAQLLDDQDNPELDRREARQLRQSLQQVEAQHSLA